MAPDAVGVASKMRAGKNGGTTTTTTSFSSSSSGRHSLKKGPWTAAEDAILMEYVKKHGEGNWNAVQRNSGLMRCGKSCRLRWANHLRPNLKKGAFCSEEEALIVELHSKLGNKWARMASQLPGRTDNEIKNYWNTRLKRRQRAGLPIYPHDVNGGKAHTYYHHHQQQQENIQAINNNPSSSSPLTSLLSPPPPLSVPAAPPVAGLNSGYRTPLSLFDIFNPAVSTMKANASYLPNLTCSQPFKFFQENNNNIIGGGGGLALSLSSPPPAPSSLPLINNNQGLPNSLSMPNCIQYNNCLNFGTDSPPPAVSGLSFEQSTGRCGVVELPSIQSLVTRATTTTTTPTSSDNNGSDDYNMIAATSSDADDHEEDFLMRGNSGLLEDLIDESEALTRSEKSKEIILPPVVEIKSQDNYLWDYKVMEGLNLGQDNNVIHDKHVQDSTSPAPSSIRAKPANNIASMLVESNPVDDDFLSLLDNFPMSVPVPDWCNENETMANGHNSNPAGGSLIGKENQNQNHEQEQESSNNFLAGTTAKKVMTTTDHNFDIGACCWKNLPGIYQM